MFSSTKYIYIKSWDFRVDVNSLINFDYLDKFVWFVVIIQESKLIQKTAAIWARTQQAREQQTGFEHL